MIKSASWPEENTNEWGGRGLQNINPQSTLNYPNPKTNMMHGLMTDDSANNNLPFLLMDCHKGLICIAATILHSIQKGRPHNGLPHKYSKYAISALTFPHHAPHMHIVHLKLKSWNLKSDHSNTYWGLFFLTGGLLQYVDYDAPTSPAKFVWTSRWYGRNSSPST